MHPIILLGAAALLLAGGKKKKSSSSSSNGLKETKIVIKPSTGSQTGNPWDRCDPPPGSSKGTHAAFGKDRKCMVFWDDSTWEVARAYITAEFNKLNESQKAALCNNNDNQADINFVKKVVISMYPQLADTQMPPPKAGSMVYFPSTVWKFIWTEYQEHICGYVTVT